jgi:transcription elongation factor Elf1
VTDYADFPDGEKRPYPPPPRYTCPACGSSHVVREWRKEQSRAGCRDCGQLWVLDITGAELLEAIDGDEPEWED